MRPMTHAASRRGWRPTTEPRVPEIAMPRLDRAEIRERQLAFVLAQEIQEALVVAAIHVEQLDQHLVVAGRLLQSARDDRAHVLARQVADHVGGYTADQNDSRCFTMRS